MPYGPSHACKSESGAWVQNRIAFTSSTKSHLDPGPNGIWVHDRITFWFKTETHLGWNQITFGFESHLGRGPNCIRNRGLNRLRVRDRIALGSRTIITFESRDLIAFAFESGTEGEVNPKIPPYKKNKSPDPFVLMLLSSSITPCSPPSNFSVGKHWHLRNHSAKRVEAGDVSSM